MMMRPSCTQYPRNGTGRQSESSSLSLLSPGMIPSLDVEPLAQDVKAIKKVLYAKPIPCHLQAQWNESSAIKKPAILPTPSLSSASDVPSDEEDHFLGVDPVFFGIEQLGRASLTLFGLPANDPERIQELLDTAQSLPRLPIPDSSNSSHYRRHDLVHRG